MGCIQYVGRYIMVCVAMFLYLSVKKMKEKNTVFFVIKVYEFMVNLKYINLIYSFYLLTINFATNKKP